MRFRDDRRGQAVQVGAVLVFATLVILMSIHQATVVPGENREIEFDDYQDATGDVTDLRNAVLATAAGGGQAGVTVQTGSRYPARAVFVNPPPATGQVRTVDAANVTLWNVTAAGDAGNVETYLGSENYRLNYSTQRLAFDPAYNEFQGAASVAVAGGFVYRDYDTPVPVASQTLIRGNRLTVVTVAGNLSAGGYRTPVTVEALSPHARTVTVESRDGEPFNVTVPTNLSAATWRDTVLADQLDPPGGPDHPDRYVRDVTDAGPRAVNVTLEGNATYELRVGRVGVRENGDSLDADAPDPRYAVRVGDRSVSTGRDGRRKLTVEVRDPLNNPVSDANVTFNASVGKFETEQKTIHNPDDYNNTVVRTDDEGRATVWFNATGHLGTLSVKAFMGNEVDSSLPSEKRVQWDVFNSVLGGDGGGGSGEQAGRSLIVLENYSGANNQNDDTITFSVDNVGSFPVNVTGYRLDYATGIQPNGGLLSGPEAVTSITVDGSITRTGNASEAKSPYFFGNDPIEMSSGSHDILFQFDHAFGYSAQSEKVENTQGVFISVAIYLEGGITVTFSVHVIL
jgi:hypothetical protein